MKILTVAFSCLLAATAAFGAVKKPSIKPAWSGAKIGAWTMDYGAALEQARAEGRYTVMLISGMWWCPHCQYGETNVWSTSEWTKFARQSGIYTTVLDNPSRQGNSLWCWLWDNSYRKAAGLTPEEATAAVVERLHIQGELAEHFGKTNPCTATNYIVEVVGSGKNVTTNWTPYAAEPTTTYRQLDYGNFVVFDPEGNIAGLVELTYATIGADGKKYANYNFDKEVPGAALAYVKEKLREIMYPGAGEPITSATQYSGIVCNDDEANGDGLVGTVTAKLAKPNKDSGLAAVTFAFTVGGMKTTFKTTVYAAENASAAVSDKSGNSLSFTLKQDGIEGVYNGYVFCAYADTFAKGSDAALEPFKGVWSAVVAGGFTDVSGCGSCGTYAESTSRQAYLDFNVAAKGKVTVTGLTAGGTRVSVKAQAVVDDGQVLFPVVDRKSGMSFVVELLDGGTARITHALSGEEFVAFGRPSAALPDSLYCTFSDGSVSKLTVKGRKLTGDRGLSLSYTPKTGVLKGSWQSEGKKVTVNGVFVGEKAWVFDRDGAGATISSVKPEGYVEPRSEDDEDCGECFVI